MLGVTTHPASQEGNGRASYPATARFRAANRPGNRAGRAVRAHGRAGSGGVRGRRWNAARHCVHRVGGAGSPRYQDRSGGGHAALVEREQTTVSSCEFVP